MKMKNSGLWRAFFRGKRVTNWNKIYAITYLRNKYLCLEYIKNP